MVAWALKEFKLGIVDLPTMEKNGVQICSYRMSKSCEQSDNSLRYVMVVVILQPSQMFKIEHASNNHFKFWVYFLTMLILGCLLVQCIACHQGEGVMYFY